MNSLKGRLLEPDEPDPVIIRHADGASPFFLTCDHAGRRSENPWRYGAACRRIRPAHRLGHRSGRCVAPDVGPSARRSSNRSIRA